MIGIFFVWLVTLFMQCIFTIDYFLSSLLNSKYYCFGHNIRPLLLIVLHSFYEPFASVIEYIG
jgi:hypothetical protein